MPVGWRSALGRTFIDRCRFQIPRWLILSSMFPDQSFQFSARQRRRLFAQLPLAPDGRIRATVSFRSSSLISGIPVGLSATKGQSAPVNSQTLSGADLAPESGSNPQQAFSSREEIASVRGVHGRVASQVSGGAG